MQPTKYDPISTTVPAEEDDNNPKSPVHPQHDELKDDAHLLLYEPRSTKPPKNQAAAYKLVRIFMLVLVMTIVATLLVLCTYMCITTECVSRNYKDLCQEGFCYQITVDNFQDSNGDKVGDFIGIKQSLKFLREIGIQSVIIPLSSFKSTSPLHDDESFIAMAKEGIKLGISTILRLDESRSPANLDLLNRINTTVSGYIAIRDSPYFGPENGWAQDIKCYTVIGSPGQIGTAYNACNGTFLEVGDVFDLGSDVVSVIKDSNDTNSSVAIVSLRSIEPTVQHNHEKHLASLVFSSLINGSIAINAKDELGSNSAGNYSDALNATNTFQEKAFALMKNIKNYRKLAPKIGRDCPIERVSVDANANVKMIVKKCADDEALEFFVAIYNNDDKEVSVSLAKVVGDLAAAVSKKILLHSLPDNANPLEVADNLALPPRSAVLVYVKSKPAVNA